MATHEDKLSKKSSTLYIEAACGDRALLPQKNVCYVELDQTEAQKPGRQNLKTRQSQIRYDYMYNYNSICPG